MTGAAIKALISVENVYYIYYYIEVEKGCMLTTQIQ